MTGHEDGVRSRRALWALLLAALACFAALTAVFWARVTPTEHPSPVPEWARVLGVIGGPGVLPVVVLAVVAALGFARRWTEARFLLVAVLGAGVSMYVARILLQAAGADEDGGHMSDFPSGHLVATTAFAAALVVLVFSATHDRPLRAVAVGVAALAVAVMGVARVEAGAHTWLDVAGGVALGLAWVLASALVAPPDGSRFPHRRTTLLVVFALGAAGFALLAALHDQDPLASVDGEVAVRVAESMPAWAEAIARPLSWIGGVVGITALCVVVLIVLVRERAWLDLAFFAAVVLGTQLAVAILKSWFDRPRPDAGSAIPLPSSASFPSGHATSGVAVFGAAAVLAAERLPERRQRVWLWTAAIALGLAIGVSRVVLNVHYVTDVLAGWCLGLAWLAACLLVRDAIRARTARI